MAGNAERTRAAIAPGSIPQGGRGAMEQAIGSSQTTPEAIAAPAMGMNPISSQDPFNSPMGALMGQGGFTSDRPVTSGLSLGPGASPPMDTTGLPLPQMQALRDIISNAKSPQLRGAALIALRRLVKNRGR